MRPEWDQRAVDGEWEPTGSSVPAVVVSDDHGTVWEVTAADGRITSLTITPPPGERLDQRALSHVPVAHLRDVALTYLADVERAWEQGMAVADALREADRARGEVAPPGGDFDVAEFAEAWHDTPASEVIDRGRKRIFRRQVLADRYGVTPEKVDIWIKQARAAGLIPPVAGQRRGRRSQTTDDK